MTIAGLRSAPVFAAGADASAITEAQADTLAPGAYLWNPSLAPDGPTVVVVKLSTQRAFVWRSGKLIGITTIASGKPGYETPDGTFAVLEKEVFHRSNKYDDAPMPYMQRLTWSGLALHGGHLHGYPASHGCIRLPMGFAAALYKESTKGMKVVITGQAPSKEQLLANRQNSHAGQQSGDLQAAGYAGGQNESNGQDEPGRQDESNPPQQEAPPADETATPGSSASPAGVYNGETGNAPDYGPDNGYGSRYSGSYRDDDRYNDYRRQRQREYQREREENRELPPPDNLPPPPNE